MFSRDLLIFASALGCLCVLLTLSPLAYSVLEKSSAFIAVLCASFHVSRLVKRTFFNKKVSPKNKAILITGCDSGFGHELVKLMDQLGYRIFACCFLPEGNGALKLKETCSSNVTVLPLDVTKDESVQDAKKFVEEKLGNHILWAIVNNAGVPQAGEIDWTPMDEIQRVYEVNTLGTVRVTKALLPLLRKSKGRIVNTTSSVGRFYCPGFVPYCMSKSAAIAFTEGLQAELGKWGIQAISIEPFFYKTSLTSIETALETVQRTWDKADQETQQVYGKAYLEGFKNSCSYTSKLSSSKIYQVVRCFEDAITSEEPETRYFPCYLPHKLGIIAFGYLPSSFKVNYQRSIVEHFATPAALSNN